MITEERNTHSYDLDNLSTLEILNLINEEDINVPLAVKNIISDIEPIVDSIVNTFLNNGRLVYIGAGTSGRLGILDASECPPTFGTNPNMIIGLIAGGEDALNKAIEGAEDDRIQGKRDLIKVNFSKNDVLIGISASGETPYVIGALEYAKAIGALTVSISSNPVSQMKKITNYSINVLVGPEIITGSTRMKSGTAQKLILNMITTTAMIKYGKVYKNFMIDVQATNEKLKRRQVKIVCEITGISPMQAKRILKKSNYNCKLAIFYKLSGLSFEKAKLILDSNNGFIRKALKEISHI